MKITGIRTHILEAKLSQPFAYSRDTRTAMTVPGSASRPTVRRCRGSKHIRSQAAFT